MILDELQDKLNELDDKVFYGAVPNKMKEALWNYTVFNRAPTRVGKNRTGYTDYFDIHIVRENYVPEGYDMQVIEKVLEIDGMRLAEADLDYTYTYKGNTDTVVEMLTIRFLRARK